jgi:hypothetical protein
VTGGSPVDVPFQAHVELLETFLANRKGIVNGIQDLLNAQRKPVEQLRDRALMSRHLDHCFFSFAGPQTGLRGRLEAAHRATGFMPRQVPGLHNDLIDPAEMMLRGFHCWHLTRWPGRNGRIRYSHALYSLYLLRCLELLGMRLWDAGDAAAGKRMTELQALLDALWRGAPADQPVLVRDARWLVPLAQSPTTDQIGAYFEIAERIADTLPDEDRLEMLKAHALMIAGHLRSQIRHYCTQDGVTLDDASIVLRTRTSNALDFALLVRCLVALLPAYEQARQSGNSRRSLGLAGAICQSISPDPELFLNRLDLLGPYCMIEYLFVATGPDGHAAYTPTGRRQLQALREYEALIGRLAALLYEDCPRFRPVEGECSPYGVIYGTPTNLTEDMALKTLQADAAPPFSVEDVFAECDSGAEKLEWVNGWRRLPHVDRDVQRLYEYPHRFAEDVFDRIERALGRRVAGSEYRAGHLFIAGGDEVGGDAAVDARTDGGDDAASIPELSTRYIVSSDSRIVADRKAARCDETRFLRDRQEGYFAVSYETPDGWLGIKKDFLTEVLGTGEDASLGIPPAAAEVLSLTCPGLVVGGATADQASMPPSIVKA